MKNVYSVYGAEQMVYNSGRKQPAGNSLGFVACIIQAIRAVARRLERKRWDMSTTVAYLYTVMLGEVVTQKKAARLLKAQVAFLGIILFSNSLLLCVACVVWFAVSIIKIKLAYD